MYRPEAADERSGGIKRRLSSSESEIDARGQKDEIATSVSVGSIVEEDEEDSKA